MRPLPPRTPSAGRATSPARPKRPNKPLSSAAPPSFTLALPAFRITSGKRKKSGGPKERRERRESMEAAARASVSGRVEPEGLADGPSTSRSRQTDSKQSSSSRRQKIKPGKAFSPCPRPQAGRRPLDFVRSGRQKRTSTPSPPPSFSDGEEVGDDKAKVAARPTSTFDRVAARNAKRGIWVGGPASSNPPTHKTSVRRPAALERPFVEQHKLPAPADLVATPATASALDIAPASGSATQAKSEPVSKTTGPRTVYPYMAPPSTGRRHADPHPASGHVVRGSLTAEGPATSPLAERLRLSKRVPLPPALPEVKAEDETPPVPIRIPTAFSRFSTPTLARPAPSAQSATPASLGPTVRTTVSLAQTLRGRISLSATVERSMLPEKTTVAKKRKRSTTADDDDKEDLGEVIQRLSKKARGPPTAAPSSSAAAATHSTPTGPPDGRLLSTFKTHSLPLVKAESSSSRTSTVRPSTTLPPYLVTPRWLYPPHSFYYAPYQLPQRPVLGLEGWQKPTGAWPPGGGDKQPSPSLAVADHGDADDVEFLREISFGGF